MRRPSTALLTALLPATLVLALVALVSVANGIAMPQITRDVAALGKLHPLAGALSSLGAFLWCAAAAISLFAAHLARASSQVHLARFLVWSGALSLYLLTDDFFQVHEDLAERYLGLDEHVLLAMLGTAVVYYLARFRQVILRTDYLILVASLGLLAGSALVDTAFGAYIWRLGHWTFFVEDGLKWLGIAAWCAYHCDTACLLLASFSMERAAVPEREQPLGASIPLLAQHDEEVVTFTATGSEGAASSRPRSAAVSLVNDR